MKKLIVIFSMFLLIGSLPVITSCTKDLVFVCDSENAIRFHKNEDCRGLKNCIHDIYEVSKQDPKWKDRTPCKICY